ncbi:MAG: amino acid adenylation domain-containing protein [Candidatus Aminicenantes bacterium]|nr:MAG: amino acid adenylation domain-containing protein [Candidatus Aminicenantes bacterium]
MNEISISDIQRAAAGQHLKEKKYWLHVLEGDITKINFPYDYQEISVNEKKFESAASRWCEETFVLLSRLSIDSDIRLHIILTACLLALLHKYSGSTDITVGMPIYKQNIEGNYINKILALRNRFNENMTFRELLNVVRTTILNAVENQDYPIEILLEDLNFSDWTSDFPLFDCIILLEDIHDRRYIEHIPVNMIFSFKKSAGHIEGKLEYNQSLYSEETVNLILIYLERLLLHALPDLDLELQAVEILSEEEKKRLLYDFNNTQNAFPKDKTLIDLFEKEVENTPDQTAVSNYLYLSDIHNQLTSKHCHPNFYPELEKCCFKKNPYIFCFENKNFLRYLNFFNEKELEKLTILKTHRNNYAAVNQDVRLLLKYLDGSFNLKSLFPALINRNLEFLVSSIVIEEDGGRVYHERKAFLITDTFDEFALLIKELFRTNLIELTDYHSRTKFVDIPFNMDMKQSYRETKDAEKEPGKKEFLFNHSAHSPQDKKTHTVLLLGDTPGPASTGLLYIASFLRRNGIDAYCQWNDFNRTTAALKENVRQLLSDLQPTILGISMKWFPHIARVFEICKIVKEYNPAIIVVVGSNTASFYKEEIIRYECIDYVIAGDGELPLLEICAGKEYIPNSVYKKDGKVVINPITYVQDEKSGSDFYFSHLDEIFVNPLDPFLAPYFYINTGKGCSQRCIYCAGCQEVQAKTFNRPKPFLRGIEEVRKDIIASLKYTANFMYDFDLPLYDSLDYYRQIWEGIDLSDYFCKFYFWMLPKPGFLELVTQTFKYVCINIDLCSLSERHRLKLSSMKLVKPQPTDEALFEFFARCEQYDNVEVVINHITGLPYFSLEDIQLSQHALAKIIKRYSCFKGMDWGRLHAQPGATIVATCENYNMHSYAKTFEDFLYYSELNLKEEIYPNLLTYNYPYIYSMDEGLNSKVTQYYANATRQVNENWENIRKNLKVNVNMTYKELSQNSTRLAKILKTRGVIPGSIVGLWVERSLEMITALLGILKAGAAYLPIDSRYPPERIRYMLKDSNANHIITKGSPAGQLMEIGFGGDIIDLMEEKNFHEDITPFNPAYTADCPAYVMYTSGSTGTPKGVVVEHKNIVRLVKNPNFITFTKNDRLLLTGTIGFDITTFEIWTPLLNGFPLFLLSQEAILDAGKLGEALIENKISILHLIPQLFNQLMEHSPGIFTGLKYLLVGGDMVRPYWVNKLRNMYKELKILHMYGPTENTTFSTYFPVDKTYEIKIPLGNPIGNSTIYILNQTNHIQPLGIYGEICVGGPGMARGYLNNPGLTGEKFINNPFNPGEKIYKTGDIGRWMPEGHIEFLGRLDQQVKIRGFRIELGEIESQLLNHEKIKEVVIINKEKDAGNPDEGKKEMFLYAYIVLHRAMLFDQTEFSSGLKEYLSLRLPDYMIPTYFIFLDKLPLTHNGKIDRKALPEPELKVGNGYAAPRNKIEKKLAMIWSEVLGRYTSDESPPGIDDDFFQLGGHSLTAINIIARIHKEFSIKLKLEDIFKMPTIRELGRHIQKAAEDKYTAVEPVEKKEYYALSSAQKRLYVTHMMRKESLSYNIPKIVVLEGKIEPGFLSGIFKRLISRHESLRTSFLMIEDEPVQRIHKEVNFEVEYYKDSQVKIEDIIKKFIRAFDLSQAPLLRVGLIKKDETQHILTVDMHHIISDGFSSGILTADFMALGEGKDLPPLKIQYKSFSEWQNRLFASGEIKHQKEYWLNRFKGDIPVLNLPLDFPGPSSGYDDEGDIIFLMLEKNLTKKLLDFIKKMKSSLYMVLLAVLNILLSKYTSQEDIVVGTPVAGRRHHDLENIIGMFVNMLAMRNRPEGNKSFMDFLNDVGKNALEAFENQDYQFEQLVDKLGLQRISQKNPLFDVVFAVLNLDHPVVETPGLTLKPYKYEDRTCKFVLRLAAHEGSDMVTISLTYSTILFKRTTVEKMAARFIEVLQQVLENTNIKLKDIAITHDLSVTTSKTLEEYQDSFEF